MKRVSALTSITFIQIFFQFLLRSCKNEKTFCENLNLLYLLVSRRNSVKNILFLGIYAKYPPVVVVALNIFPHFQQLVLHMFLYETSYFVFLTFEIPLNPRHLRGKASCFYRVTETRLFRAFH